ncbi:MAG: hypothetical protein BM557_02040 [Flavobacterium sp. MedPE-SWcel]|uniref:hypothetical protein n=1 Tax=uncultured Flavobacterium sp. TaxID=165435 RepID=UPI000923732B|nr:hypothetical protein [uncultured Flavobacterium sp.]OIQ22178.1 MAG: hypothetical protein BM557_02040 [Flavobacterium sp. MedPE-SWcel]
MIESYIAMIVIIVLFVAFLATGMFVGYIVKRNKTIEEEPIVPCTCDKISTCKEECTLRKMLKKNL